MDLIFAIKMKVEVTLGRVKRMKKKYWRDFSFAFHLLFNFLSLKHCSHFMLQYIQHISGQGTKPQ